tara:strand:+ start:6275 stop:6637 length:363 start_codon:yes stop_codon:yes gene_type:complete
MATINLTINGGISDLLQVGDQVYYANNASFGGFSSTNTIDDVIHIGECIHIDNANNQILVDTGTLSFAMPTSGAYILFSKDNAVNLTSLIGYFASIKLKNNSNIKSEIFQVGVDIDESSK